MLAVSRETTPEAANDQPCLAVIANPTTTAGLDSHSISSSGHEEDDQL